MGGKIHSARMSKGEPGGQDDERAMRNALTEAMRECGVFVDQDAPQMSLKRIMEAQNVAALVAVANVVSQHLFPQNQVSQSQGQGQESDKTKEVSAKRSFADSLLEDAAKKRRVSKLRPYRPLRHSTVFSPVRPLKSGRKSTSFKAVSSTPTRPARMERKSLPSNLNTTGPEIDEMLSKLRKEFDQLDREKLVVMERAPSEPTSA